jgi:hypothetical protein
MFNIFNRRNLAAVQNLPEQPVAVGSDHSEVEIQAPGEPHLLANGKTVLVHTFSCGLYQLEGIETDQQSVRYLKTFDGDQADVPLQIGHYWLQTLSSMHALASYDISDLAHIREVSRVTFDDKQKPHWIAADADGRRIVLNSGEYGEHRLFMVNFDPQTGALKLDGRFRDPGSERRGVSMDGKSWGYASPRNPCGQYFRVLRLGFGAPRQGTRSTATKPEVDVPSSKDTLRERLARFRDA